MKLEFIFGDLVLEKHQIKCPRIIIINGSASDPVYEF